MHVFINEQEIMAGAAPGATIGEIVEASRMHVDPTEIMTEVELDGVAFHAGDEQQFARRAATGVQRLTIRTRTPAAFASDKRRSLAETLDAVAQRTRIVVTLLRESNTRTANGLLACLMEELRLTLLLDYQLSLLAEDALSTIAREEIATVAPQLLNAEEKRSWQILAELLEKKLAPTLERWAAATRARLDATA
jgi:glutamyl/glutaminyl-tRNA synthetase